MNNIEKNLTEDDPKQVNQSVSQEEIDGLVNDLHRFQAIHNPVIHESGITSVRCALAVLADYKESDIARKTFKGARERLNALFTEAEKRELAKCA